MQVQGFLGGTYLGRSTSYLSDRTVNFYPEVSAAPDPKQVVAMFGTPGLSLFTTAGLGPIRGSHVFNGYMYVVSGAYLYRVSTDGTVSSSLGTLATSSGPVRIINNGIQSGSGVGGNQLGIVDGSHLYIFNVATSTFTQVSTSFTPSSISFIDGYFVVVDNNTMSSYCSDLYDGLTWNGLATSAVSATPDYLMACCTPHQELWLIKEYSTEAWYDAGTATSVGFPFLRIPGVVMDYGTPAKDSVVVGDNSVFMLAQNRVGQEGNLIGVIQFQGYAATPIMPPPLVYKISKMSRVDDAIAWMYSAEGHTFYVITFPTGDSTLVYDISTQMWHERSSYSGSPYDVHRHRMNSLSTFNNKHYVGDYINGNIYELSTDNYDDNGDPIVSMRIAPHLFDKQDMNNIFIHKLTVDVEGGVGDSSGSEPTAELSWSNDGGMTWSNSYIASLGKLGKYKYKLRWRKLGYSRDRVFKLVISDTCKRVLLGAYVEASR